MDNFYRFRTARRISAWLLSFVASKFALLRRMPSHWHSRHQLRRKRLPNSFHQPSRSIGNVYPSHIGHISPSGIIIINNRVANQIMTMRMHTNTPMNIHASVQDHRPGIGVPYNRCSTRAHGSTNATPYSTRSSTTSTSLLNNCPSRARAGNV